MTEKINDILRLVQKPGRYSGGELNSVIKDKKDIELRFAFCFPDTYEVGMSHLGMKILYSLLNDKEGIWCERVFAPLEDMAEKLREASLPLYALESADPVNEFDIIGFTLQYEMSYTTILYMLDLAGIPLKASERHGLKNLVIAGGPCSCNPEPITDFIDIFFLGESEEALLELCELYKICKDNDTSKEEFLIKAAKVEGLYVPSLIDVSYNENGAVAVAKDNVKLPINKRIINDLDKSFYPKEFVVPYIDIVHDRIVEEIFRGCSRGCRFCQAGFIYRPMREKEPSTIISQAKNLCESSGYDELSLASLSTSDYSALQPLLDGLLDYTSKNSISLSLPSLRIDNFSGELLEKIKEVRKSGLTFAPEAGSQRLRDAINKNVTEEEIMSTCSTAFAGGYDRVKLYFMIGLPTETMEDIKAIADLAERIVELYYSSPYRQKGKIPSITISLSTFVPKAFTPFQFCGQISLEEIEAKQKYLLECVTSRKIRVKYHDSKTSFLEAAFARGDRRLNSVVETAYKSGCYFDAWDEHFSFSKWTSAFSENLLRIEDFANRAFSFEEILPWEHLNYYIDKSFLINEYKKALDTKTTEKCGKNCEHCGIITLIGGACPAHSKD